MNISSIRKIFLSIMLSLLSLNIFAKELTVMSFNIQGHGPNSSNHRFGNDNWENQLISAIDQSKADIVLLQEVPLMGVQNNISQTFLNKMSKKKSSWKSITSGVYSISNRDLNNAVLYNEAKVILQEDFAKKQPFNMAAYKLNPSIDDRRFKFSVNNEQILEFSIRNSDLHFYVVNVHLPGPNEKEKLYEERRVIEELYAYCKRKLPVIIGGDFNHSRKDLIRGSNFGDAIIDGKEGIYIDVWGQKSTVTEDNNSFKLKNDFDHFIINPKNIFSVSEQMHLVFSKNKIESFSKLKIGRAIYTDSKSYHEGLSDHLPIMIKLSYNIEK